MLNRCSNVSLATFRIAPCEIEAKTAFRSSPNSVVMTLAVPSALQRNPTKPWLDSQPAMAVPAKTQTVVLESIGTFRLSTMSLKKNGTCTLRIFPPTSNVRAVTTRAFVENPCFGHIFTASFLMMAQSVNVCALSETAFEGVSTETAVDVTGGLDGDCVVVVVLEGGA